jgi:hypothetical protein
MIVNGTKDPLRSVFRLSDGHRGRTCTHRKAGTRLVVPSPEGYATRRGDVSLPVCVLRAEKAYLTQCVIAI